MAAVATYDELVARALAGYHANWPIYGETTATAGIIGGNYSIVGLGSVKTLPALPSGVSGYIPTCLQSAVGLVSVPRIMMYCEVINLGSLDISGPTFTDGDAFPTRMVLGTSRQLSGPVFCEIENAALAAAPGSMTITYVDQDGNAAETTASLALPTTNANPQTVGPIPLNTGDVGVRDITAATRTGGTTPTGTLRFWGIIPIAYAASGGGGCQFIYPMHTQAFNWSKLYGGSKLRVFTFGAATSHTAHGMFGCIDIVGDSV